MNADVLLFCVLTDAVEVVCWQLFLVACMNSISEMEAKWKIETAYETKNGGITMQTRNFARPRRLG